jgi:hypothetical protein
MTTHFAAMFAGCLKSLTRFEQASGAAAVLKMSSIARLRSDSSPQKLKVAAQQSFSGAAEAESKLEEERKRKEESAAKRREERKRLDELQRLKDEEDAEEAARRIVDSSSRIARMRLEDLQRRELSLRLQQAEEAPPSPPPPPAADPPREQCVAPARAGASSPVKKYLRNELRFVCFVCVCWVDFICSGTFFLGGRSLFWILLLIHVFFLRSAVALKNKSLHSGVAASSEPANGSAAVRLSGGKGAAEGSRSLSRLH